MTESKNAIVVGAGHNGLCCAAYLAKAGYDVVVLEAADSVGGTADTREFAPGFRASGCAQFVTGLSAEVVRDLDLERHGLSFSERSLATIALAENGETVRIDGDALDGAVSERDRSKHAEFRRQVDRFAGLLGRYLKKSPPKLANNDARDKLTLAQLGLDIRRLGRDDMRDFLRVIAINSYDWLNEFYDNDLIKGAYALDSVLGGRIGPRSPTTVFTLLYRFAGDAGPSRGAFGQPDGGMGSVSNAFLGAAESAGAQVRTGSPVEEIIVEHGKVTGVRLAGGEVIRSLTVVSGADPKTTLLSLVGARHLETGFTRRVANYRTRGNAAKINLALSAMPGFNGVAESDLGERLVIAPDMDYVERAFNPAKYGEYSPEPVLEIQMPSVRDLTLAPAGQHVLSATVQYAPYDLRADWDDDSRGAFFETVVTTLERYAPGIRELILDQEMLTPLDIEEHYRISGGHWHHGELVLDQFLFVRPVVGAAQYAMPVDGLYLCGAGAHPGGGVTGLPGRNAAKTILAAGSSR